MVEKCEAIGYIGDRGNSEGQLSKRVGYQYGIWNWMHQRIGGFGEIDASSSRVLFFISGGRGVLCFMCLYMYGILILSGLCRGVSDKICARPILWLGVAARPSTYRNYILNLDRRDGFLCLLSDCNPTSRLLHYTASRMWPT